MQMGQGPVPAGPPTPGVLLHYIRQGLAQTRAELAALTGLARSTVSQRVDTLIELGLVYEAGDGPSSGGRPPTMLAFNAGAGLILAADLGATHCRVRLSDLDGRGLAEFAEDLPIDLGPDVVLESVQKQFSALLEREQRSPDQVRAIGMGLPGPVEFAAGRPVNPPIMPGWDGVSVPQRIQKTFPVPVLVDNDVNIMALGEYWIDWRDSIEDLLFVKVGTGIGAGIVTGGQIYRGAQGAAGDIGHIVLADHRDVTCRCGNRGCVEAMAGGAALARQLRELGLDATTSRDVVRLVREGNPAATQLTRSAGRLLGEVLAGIVNFFNPARIIIGGDVAYADEQLLAGVREVVYQRATALATRDLEIRQSRLGDQAGVTGASVMALEHILDSRAIDQAVAGQGLERAG
jgi:predicted NBD/HSP70 family sugar kinase